MALERGEYSGMLPKLQPGQAVDILNDRVAQVGRLNNSIAGWLAERRQLEEQYAAALRRLARKTIDEGDLGIFSVPWSAITGSLDTLAEAHATLATKVEVDIERPLREFTSQNGDMQQISTAQGNLSALAKEMDKAAEKTEKLLGKGDKADANKLANATSDLDNARVQWDAQAPYVFEKLQSLDERRVNQLRDMLTQLQTIETDAVEKSRVAAEQCLNVLLNVETADEIKTFALRSLNAKPKQPQRATYMTSSSTSASRTASSTVAAAAAAAASSSSPRGATNDNASEISEGMPEPKKAFAKGLRRFGTVMSRSKRESKMPAALPSTAEAPEEKKPKPSPFSRLGRSKNSYGMEPPQEEPSTRQRPHSPLRMGSEILESPVPQTAPQLGEIPRLNGNSSALAQASSGQTYANGSHQSDLTGLQPPNPYNPTAAEPPRDSEGFSVPPAALDPISQAQADAAAEAPQFNVNIRNAPIEEEGGEAALASMATKLQAPPPVSSRRAGTVRGRRDARNSAVPSNYAPPEPAYAEHSSAGTVAERSATADRLDPNNAPFQSTVPQSRQLAAEPSSSSLVSSPSGTLTGGVLAGGAAVAGASTFMPSDPPQSPTFRPSPRLDDNQSIRSGRSTASQALPKHPGLHDQGLTSSIIETVFARFENGQLATSSIIGEIALGFSGPPVADAESIRLSNITLLDKIAPNPQILRSSTTGAEGEYILNIPILSRGNAVAFKYQLHGDETAAYAPLVVHPVCKFEEGKADIIVNYSLSRSFAMPAGASSIVLSGLTIALTLEGAKASTCLSRPEGTFVRERNMVAWALGDVELRIGGQGERLLARFPTEGMARGGSVEAKWEVQGGGSGVGVAVWKGGADPFADGDEGSSWRAVGSVRKMVAGSYGAR